MSIPAKWLLHVRPEPNESDPEGWRRLRAFLKCALRSYGIRCINITTPEGREVPAEDESKGGAK